jgi:hypothetical protein
MFSLTNTNWLVAYRCLSLLINQPSDDQRLADGYPWQMYILHDSPYNCETRYFRGEGINLIRTLSHIAEKTFNGIGGANVAVHHQRKIVIGQKMLLVFAEAPYGVG